MSSENASVVSKRQCLLYLVAVQMEWGKVGGKGKQAEEGHTASYRHPFTDATLVSLKLCKARVLLFSHMEGRFLSICQKEGLRTTRTILWLPTSISWLLLKKIFGSVLQEALIWKPDKWYRRIVSLSL